MGINTIEYRKGGTKIELRKRWPDRAEYRRFFPNRTKAREVEKLIDASILNGTWLELRQGLARGTDLLEVNEQQEQEKSQSFKQISELFLQQYARPRLKSWKRYEQAFSNLNARLGSILIHEFSRTHLYEYVEQRRCDRAKRWVKKKSAGQLKELSYRISRATVNREIAAAKKMCSFAVETGILEHNPLLRFKTLKEQQISRPLLTLDEYHQLVESMPSLRMKVYIAVVGETGLRRSEALSLRWDQIKPAMKLLMVDNTKNYQERTIPLSDYAIGWIRRLVRRIDSPLVFAHPKTGKALTNPDSTLRRLSRRLGLGNLGLHDLRRFRATQWYLNGVHPRTIQHLLGHADLKTTLRYLRHVEHAVEEVRQAQIREAVGEKRVTRQAGVES